MPSVLGDFGLGAALNLLATQTALTLGINVMVEVATDGEPISSVAAIGLYRIAQEALNNAVKHADAQLIRIQLQRDRKYITLIVEDNGKGFMEKPFGNGERHIPTSKGLDNMRTRARLLNGDFKITSRLKKGTKVSVKLNLSTALLN
jgi:signal transduction histidine kinase